MNWQETAEVGSGQELILARREVVDAGFQEVIASLTSKGYFQPKVVAADNQITN